MQEIAPRIYVETAYPPVTVGAILTDEGWVIIDTPPMPRDAEAWVEALRAVSDLPVLYVINTDAHRDRILGNGWFDAPVVAQSSAAQQILNLKNGFISQAAEDMSGNDNELVAIASLRLVTPQVSYAKTLALHCGSQEIVLTHRPGSSFGNSWVMLEAEEVLFAGDSVINGQHPIIADSTTRAWLETLTELESDQYMGWTIVPGRGKVTDRSVVADLADYLRTARKRISVICKAGRPRSEVASIVPELMNAFAFDNRQKDDVQRRVRLGLEAIYEEFRSVNGGDELDEAE
jgi:cyclase